MSALRSLGWSVSLDAWRRLRRRLAGRTLPAFGYFIAVVVWDVARLMRDSDAGARLHLRFVLFSLT